MVLLRVTSFFPLVKVKINCAKDKDKLQAGQGLQHFLLFIFEKSCQDANRGWGSPLVPQYHLKSLYLSVRVGVCVSAYDLYQTSQDWQQSARITFTVTVMHLTLVFIRASPSTDVNRERHSRCRIHTFADAKLHTYEHIHRYTFHCTLLDAWETIWNGGSVDDQPSAVIGSLVTQQIHVSIGHMGY